jgi:hypothetical protein
MCFGSNSLSKGQQAMALAMLYPEPEKGGRGRKSEAGKLLVSGGFPRQRLDQARTVLAHSRTLAEAVLADRRLLNVALQIVERRSFSPAYYVLGGIYRRGQSIIEASGTFAAASAISRFSVSANVCGCGFVLQSRGLASLSSNDRSAAEPLIAPSRTSQRRRSTPSM